MRIISCFPFPDYASLLQPQERRHLGSGKRQKKETPFAKRNLINPSLRLELNLGRKRQPFTVTMDTNSSLRPVVDACEPTCDFFAIFPVLRNFGVIFGRNVMEIVFSSWSVSFGAHLENVR